MILYGKILGVQHLGKTHYSKYTYVCFSESGILFFDDFLADDSERSYSCGAYVRIKWSTRSLKYFCYPLDDDLVISARSLWSDVLERSFTA